MTLDHWLVLACAPLFAASALAIKRGNELGVDAWTATLASNLATVAGFLCLWPLGGNFPGYQYLGQPALVALLFIVGQWLAFLAFAQGAVSVATPILGTKIILVALSVALLIGDT